MPLIILLYVLEAQHVSGTTMLIIRSSQTLLEKTSLQPEHYSSLTAPKLQPTATQGMYNFRFTILINTNNTLNYQSTNETHYTKENTMITTHKGLQLLILMETRYQLQPSDKELHTKHTPLRTIIIH